MTLPRPEGWAPRPGLGAARRAGLVVLVVLGLAAGASTRTGSTLPGLIGFLACLVAGAVLLTTRPRPSARLPETGALQVGGARTTGLVLPLRRPSRLLLVLVALLAVLFLAGAAVTWALLGTVPPEAVFGLVSLAVFGTLFALAALALWSASGRPAYVGLTPSHLLVSQTDGSQVELPWSDLVSVDAVVARTGVGPIPEAVGTWTALRARSGSTALAAVRLRGPASRVVRVAPGPNGTTTAGLVGDTQWDVDPVLAWWTLEYYRRHHTARRELSGPAAVERTHTAALLD